MAKTLSPRLFKLHFTQLVSLGLRIYNAHTNLPTRGPASTNLVALSPALWTCPPVVQHTWSTSYVPPRTQHPSSVSTEHTNLPCSYPHTRVLGYETSHSYRQVFTTINEPTRSWHNISRSKSASLRPNNIHKSNLQHNRLPRCKRRQAKPVHTTWRDILVTKRCSLQEPPYCSYRLTATPVLPGVIPVAHQF